MLNEKLIRQICSEQGYGYNYFGTDAVITTHQDQWNLQTLEVYEANMDEYVNIIKLKHKNKSGNRKGKSHFHTQRIFKHLHQALRTIIDHEKSDNAYNKAFKIKTLL